MANISITKAEIKDLQNDLDCQIYVDDQMTAPNKLEIVKMDRENGGVYGMIRKAWPLPKNKEVNRAYVLGKYNTIEHTNNYHNLRTVFESLKIKGNIYYTSFGFSYDCFFKSSIAMDKEIKELQSKLDSLGIKYTNEFSSARWVYRFKISQSKENINKINHLK